MHTYRVMLQSISQGTRITFYMQADGPDTAELYCEQEYPDYTIIALEWTP